MQPVGAALDSQGKRNFNLDINATYSRNRICCDGQKQGTQSKDNFESYSPVEKFSWSSPRFVGLPVDAARCILNVRINCCLLQRAEMGSELWDQSGREKVHLGTEPLYNRAFCLWVEMVLSLCLPLLCVIITCVCS